MSQNKHRFNYQNGSKEKSSILQKSWTTVIPIMLVPVLWVFLWSCSPYEFELQGTKSTVGVYSTIVDDEFQLYTYLPPNDGQFDQLPVIFLLDGDWYFDGLVRELNELIQDGRIPPVMLIGIGYQKGTNEKRFRDYTFPEDPEYDISNGRADKFSRFLTEELLPLAKSEHPIDTTNMIIMGHSLGGLNALFNMFQINQPFSACVAISSSLWWQNGHVFGLEERFYEQHKDLPARVFLAVGGDEPPSMTILQEELTERLYSRNYSGLELRSEFFKGASHSQVPMKGFKKGIEFVLTK
jgi:predicted alpha/beta superfamily hydrolase